MVRYINGTSIRLHRHPRRAEKERRSRSHGRPVHGSGRVRQARQQIHDARRHVDPTERGAIR